MKIKLTVYQYKYIYSKLSEEREDLVMRFKSNESNNEKVVIEIDKKYVDDIRDWVEEELQKVGFDINYELTEEGKILEELSNKLYS